MVQQQVQSVIYTEKYSDFHPSQKVQVKWAMAGGANVVGAMVTFVQEDDKVRAVAKVGGSWVGGLAAATAAGAPCKIKEHAYNVYGVDRLLSIPSLSHIWNGLNGRE